MAPIKEIQEDYDFNDFDIWSVGQLAIGTSTLGSFALTTKLSDAATNTVTDVVKLDHATSGVAAAGYGTGVIYYGEDAAGTSRVLGRVAGIVSSAAVASFTGGMTLEVPTPKHDTPYRVVEATTFWNDYVAETGPGVNFWVYYPTATPAYAKTILQATGDDTSGTVLRLGPQLDLTHYITFRRATGDASTITQSISGGLADLAIAGFDAFHVNVGVSANKSITVDNDGNTIIGVIGIDGSGTTGYPAIPTTLLTPSGVAGVQAGAAALIYDYNAHRLWVRENQGGDQGWHWIQGATVAGDITWTTNAATLTPASGTTLYLAMGAGTTAAVSAANTGRIRYNVGTQTFQMSLNGAAYADIGTGAGTIGGSIANTQVAVGSGANTIAGSAALTFASNLLLINANAATPPAATSGTMLHIAPADSGTSRLLMDAFAGAAGITFRYSNGTAAAPTQILLNNSMGSIGTLGYGLTAYATTARALVQFLSAENWSDAAQGTYIKWSTTPVGSSTLTNYMMLGPDGNLGIGTSFTSYAARPTSLLHLSSTAPTLTMTDTTAAAKSLTVTTDANITTFKESAGSAFFTLDLANNRVGVGVDATAPAFPLTVQYNNDGTCYVASLNANGGTSATSGYRAGNGTYGVFLVQYGTGFSSAVPYATANAAIVGTDGPGGFAIISTNAAGVVRVFSGGAAAANERINVSAAGVVTMGTISSNPAFSFDGANQLTLGVASSKTGQLRLYNSGAANATILQAGAASGAVTYTLPTAAPTADGYSLTSATGGVMSWKQRASTWSCGSNLVSSGQYLPRGFGATSATETPLVTWIAPANGKLLGVIINVTTAPGGADTTTATVRDNGSDTTTAVSVSGINTAALNTTTNTITLGHAYTVRLDFTGNNPTNVEVEVMYILD